MGSGEPIFKYPYNGVFHKPNGRIKKRDPKNGALNGIRKQMKCLNRQQVLFLVKIL